MNVETITEAHCSAGIVTYEHFGSLTPKFWAQSISHRGVLEPMHAEALALDFIRGVMMIGLLSDATDARFIGRSAEAWTKTHSEDEPITYSGLAEIADNDPEVHTAIIAQGFDLWTADSHLAMATFDLDEHAQTVWSRVSKPGPTGQFDLLALHVQEFLSTDRPPLSRADIEGFINGCGWAMTVTDA